MKILKNLKALFTEDFTYGRQGPAGPTGPMGMMGELNDEQVKMFAEIIAESLKIISEQKSKETK